MSNETDQLLESLTDSQKHAVEIMQTFIGLYGSKNKGNGEGLFSGISRHTNLENRVPLIAMSSSTIMQFWGKLCDKMLVSMPTMKSDLMLIKLWSLPNQREIIQVLRKESQQTCIIARAIQSSLSAAKKAEWEAIQSEQNALEKALENNTALTELKDDGFADKEIPFGDKEPVKEKGSLL
jgi:hypothetical protein